MIITCEKCSTKFALSDEEVAKINSSGRILKCGNCYHMWLAIKSPSDGLLENVSHEPTDQNLIEEIKDNQTALTLLNVAPSSPIADYFTIAALPTFLKISFYSLIFLALFALMIVKKETLLDNMLLRPFMHLVGLTKTEGLQFEKVTISKDSLAFGKALIISGYVVNKSENDLIIPDIRIQFLDEQGEVMKAVTHNLPVQILASGEQTKIANKIGDYPRGAHTIILDIGNYLEFVLL